MSDSVFVDISALIALINSSHPHHRQAADFLESAQVRNITLVSVLDVLPVLADQIRRSAGIQISATAISRLRRTQLIRFEALEEQDEEEAWRIFSAVRELNWSFAESALVAVMNRRKIEEIFSFNPGFRKFGFGIIPEGNA